MLLTVLVVLACLPSVSLGNHEVDCASLPTSGCLKQPCQDPERECPKMQCVKCGCEAKCLPFQAMGSSISTQQSVGEPHISRSLLAETVPLCPGEGGGPAAPCPNPKGTEITCANVDCLPNMTCDMYTCDGKCIPLCHQKCPNERPPVQCLVNPCQGKDCGPNAMCIPNYCGNCSYSCMGTPAEGLCADNKPPVNCFADPCMRKKCSGSSRKCVQEYCGGCNAACLLKKACKNGNKRRPCMDTANRCITVKVGKGASCVPDQCDDCKAKIVGPCKPGYFISTDYAKCVRCFKGYACAGGDSNTSQPTAEPVPCNNGLYQDKRGQAQCKKCADGTSTPATPKTKGWFECIATP